MDRLISENAVLEVFREYQGSISDFYKAVKAIPSAEPCEDAISRQAVIDSIDKWVKNMGVLIALPANEVTPLFDSIHELPSVKPQEPKTGHWIEQIDHEENCRTLICSNCDRPALHDGDSIWKHKFCPHCGAKMD